MNKIKLFLHHAQINRIIKKANRQLDTLLKERNIK